MAAGTIPQVRTAVVNIYQTNRTMSKPCLSHSVIEIADQTTEDGISAQLCHFVPPMVYQSRMCLPWVFVAQKLSEEVIPYCTQRPMISTEEVTTPEMTMRGNCIFITIRAASEVQLCMHLPTTQWPLDYYCFLTTVYIRPQHRGIELRKSNNISDAMGKRLKIAETLKMYQTHAIVCNT